MSEETEVKNVKLSIYLPEDMRAKFKSACALRRKSMNEVLTNYIERFTQESENTDIRTNTSDVA